MHKLAVIILNWRTADLAENCIVSVLASKVPQWALSVIVIDNRSDDGSAESLQSKFADHITLIECAVNNGYAGGMNVGLTKAKEIGAEYALLLNADITLTESTIEEFVSAAQSRDDGAFFGPESTTWASRQRTGS